MTDATDNVEAVLVAALDPRLVAVSPDSPLTHEELSYMLPRDDPAFLAWVNLWLHQMTLGGELERLREKWMTAASSRSAGVAIVRPPSPPEALGVGSPRRQVVHDAPGAQVGDSLVVQLDHQLGAGRNAFDLGSRQIIA